jgi:hypothetical protein
MRDTAMLFEQELARRNCHISAPSLPRFVGMVEWDPESIYDLLPSTLGDMDSESSSEGSYHPVWGCNMLHLLGNGTAVGGEKDNAYAIPCTPGEQAEYKQEHLE